jgi:hypothetical protein
MSRDHHRVRNYVVRDLPRNKRPIPFGAISQALHSTRQRTASIVNDDLERKLFFLVRGDGEEVSWAFPVTAEETGYHLIFSTGERLDAVWAEGAITTPFVKGHLRTSRLEAEIRSTSAHCGEAIGLVVNSELNYRITRGGPAPLVCEPEIDWATFSEPSIFDGY